MGIGAREVGDRIREARKKAGLSQMELAEKVDISLTHMGNIENGKKDFTVEILIRIAEALSCSADDILGLGISSSASRYEQKLYSILEGCTDKEKESILEAIRNLKKAFRGK